MGIQSGVPGAAVEAVSTFSGTGPVAYQPMIPPSQTYQLDTQSQGPHRYIKPEDTQASARHHQRSIPASPGPPHSPLMRPPVNDKSPTSAAKNSPLSLAAITSPFHPDAQSKNCHAQTLMLGECLRPGSQALEDPAVLSSEMTPIRRTRRPSQEPHRRFTWITPYHQAATHRRCKCSRHREDSWTHLISRFYRHEMSIGRV